MTTTTLDPTVTPTASAVPSARSLARILESRTEAVYALVRIALGLLFAFHGAQKRFGWYMPFEIPVGSQVWFGSIIELATGCAIAAGMLARPAAFLASGTMAVAYTQFHWKLQGGSNFFPAVNQGEPAAMYAFIFLYLATRGGVKWAACKES